MELSDIKEILPTLDNVEFQLENGIFVPEHFRYRSGCNYKEFHRLWWNNQK